jgi:DNA mismatch repair protein MutS
VEHAEKLVFLHSVKEGPANQSYGLQVAQLAGIPSSVITQARRYLTELERERDALRAHSSPQAELPLFSPPAIVHVAARDPAGAQSGFSTPRNAAALEALRATDPNLLSPREALDLLYRLKDLDSAESAAQDAE